MEPLVEVLAAGGRTNSLGRSAEVLALLRADGTRIEELFACIDADDAWVRMRAVDTFEKLVREDPTLATPFVPRIVHELTRSEQPSVQWHVAQLLDLVTLTPAQEVTAVRWLEARVTTTDVDWIVAAQAMATLVSMHARGLVPSARLDALLAVQEGHRSASVRRKATRLREALRAQG